MNDEEREMWEDLLHQDSGLSGWEMDFIESMDGYSPLSIKQSAKLKQIWERVVNQ